MFHSKTRGFFHQPPQLAGSAAAPPALPELTPDRAACRAALPRPFRRGPGRHRLRAGRPEPSRYARPHRSLRSLSLTFVPVPPLTMPRVARAPAIPPPSPLPALSLVLTGKVSVVSVKKGRLRTKSGIFDSSLGKKGETTIIQTTCRKGRRGSPVPFRSAMQRRPPCDTGKTRGKKGWCGRRLRWTGRLRR